MNSDRPDPDPVEEDGGRGGAGARRPEIPDYELLRCIGRGSYGEVWLGRSVTGACHAVKIIYRDRFEDDVPYDREFKGLQKFEPVSRAHEHVVDILHVGRQDGFFFYVMELADDACMAANSGGPVGQVPNETDEPSAKRSTPSCDSSYCPFTLRERGGETGRLSFGQCLETARQLACALDHLHSHGLVHRDVKPSNVIFVGGVAKLADVGLVAELDTTMTSVGTAGYLPPEGSGGQQADIFALGKVLYEISTGRDRMDFPELPTSLSSDSEKHQWAEFNEIVVKACEPDSNLRYASAKDMLADIELIQAGTSVLRNRRLRERWFRAVRLTKLAVVLVALLAVGALIHRWIQKEPRPAPVFTNLVIPAENIRFNEFRGRNFDFSPDGKQFLFARGTGLHLWEQGTGITSPFEIELKGWGLTKPRYSPDGSRIAFLATRNKEGAEQLYDLVRTIIVANADGSECRQLGEPFEIECNHLFWKPDASAVMLHTQEGGIEVDMFGTKTPRPDLPLTLFHASGSYSPDGRWIATVQPSENRSSDFDADIWVLAARGGRATQVTSRKGLDTHPVWSDDGTRLFYVSSQGSSYGESWNLREIDISSDTGSPVGDSRALTHFEDTNVLYPMLVKNGKQIAFCKRTGQYALWIENELEETGPRPVTRGALGCLSPDGTHAFFVSKVANRPGIFRIPVAGGAPKMILDSSEHFLGHYPSDVTFRLSPDGETIAFVDRTRERSAMRLISSNGGVSKELFTISEVHLGTVPVWSPDSQQIAYAWGSKLSLINTDGSGKKQLSDLYDWLPNTVQWSPDGQLIAALGYESAAESDAAPAVFVVSLGELTTQRVTSKDESEYKEGLSWHPDGQRLTYMRYGGGSHDAEIRWAYADGRPTEFFIDVADRWDYVGSWSPDGDRFFFLSFGRDRQTVFVKHLPSGEIEPAPHSPDSLPAWSSDGKTRIWSAGETDKEFWVIEGF